jgi:hypothetical protein
MQEPSEPRPGRLVRIDHAALVGASGTAHESHRVLAARRLSPAGHSFRSESSAQWSAFAGGSSSVHLHLWYAVPSPRPR